MDLDPVHFFSLLYRYLEDDSSGSQQCNQLFANLNDLLTQEQVNLPDLDLYLQHFFNKSRGFPEFVTRIINKKQFKSSIIKVFEIIYTLINNFPSKLEKYIIVITDICLKIIKSSLVTSDEKVKSLEVLTLSFQKIDKCLEISDHYKDIYSDLLKTISIKKCSTVEGKIYIALGTFAQHFELFVPDPQSLRNVFLNGLEKQIIEKDFSHRTVGGIFTGFDNFCETFPLDRKSEEDVNVINKLYKFIDKIAIPKDKIKIANRAALTFLANNISSFINLIVEKFKYWHEILLNWLTYGSEDQKVAVLVLESFYRGLGEFLLNDMSQKYKPITMYFNDYFQKNLTKEDISNRHKRLCLQGLASFSAVFQIHLSEDEMKELLILLVQNFEKTFVVVEPSSEVLEYLPFYIHTVTKFVHFRKITNSELFCLQKTTITMIKIFPQIPYSCHDGVIEALVSTFYFLSINDEKIFDKFVENIVYQGVVWTCSHQHISEAEILQGDSQDVVTVKNYFNLWKGLMNILPLRKFDKNRIFLHDRKFILVKIIDKLVRTMLILINKLNISIVLNNTTEPVTDIEAAYTVAESNDFAIFLNIVDFYEEIFEEIDPVILKKCVSKLIHHLIAKCSKYPLISGFYKLLSFFLKICNKINYFNESNQDITNCHSTLVKFSETLLNKTQQFKGDLLIACLQVLLEYPVIIIGNLLPACVPSFKTIFNVGRTYIKLAFMAFDTLEHWQKEITRDEMEPFLIEIIPLLDSYLQSKCLGGLTETNVENRRKTARALKKRKVVLDVEPELLKLQMRIIKFVGQQRSELCQVFAFREDDIGLAVWGNERHLKVVLPYEDMKLEIYLDKLLPRIVNVALNSTDRKTRVVACELLQATVMVFLGTTKQMSESGKSDLNELLRHIAVPLLKLGCDMDQVVEQLFRPLCYQLIHWYTHFTQSRKDHSAIIIEAMLESITHPTDTALRDFSGKCICEFVRWTIKQSSEKNLAKDPINIKILLKKMRFYSMHPDPFKKIGAALIFNNIYREVREESSLLSIFWIEFLHVFVRSLSTVTDENSVTQINNALSHIERGFVEKPDLFNKDDRDRRVPIDIRSGILKDTAVWLLEQTGSNSPYCRGKCMELFSSITPKTKGFKTLQTFVGTHFKKENWVQETYESFLVQSPTLESECEPHKWMQALLCALDGYIFVTSQKLVLKTDLSTTILTSIKFFIDKISTVRLDEAYAMIRPTEWIFTNLEKQTFDKQRSQVVLKIFKLCSVLPDFEIFCTPKFWELLVNMIFNREILGFEPFFLKNNSDDEIVPLLRDFFEKLPENRSLEFWGILQDHVNLELYKYISQDSDFDLKSNVTLKQRNILKGLNIIQALSIKDFLLQTFSTGMVASLLNKFIDYVENDIIYIADLQDTTITYCVSLFDFALENENEFFVLIDFLYKPYQVQTSDCKQPVHFGTYLLTIFEDSIIHKIIKNFEMFLNMSLEKSNTIDQVLSQIFQILTYTVPKKQLKHISESIVKSILTNWETFQNYFDENVNNIESGLDFVKHLLPVMKSCRIQDENLKNWLCVVLSTEANLTWKQELDLKVEVFYLLVDVLDAEDDQNELIRQGLEHVKAKLQDPLKIPLEAKIIFLDKLLTTIPKIKTSNLFMFLLEVYVKLPTENSNSDVKTLLSHISGNEKIQKVLLSDVYSLYFNEDFNSSEKYKLITNTIPLFQYCSHQVFEDFFVANISNMISTLKEPINSDNLIEKIAQFVLLDVLFLRCPIQSGDQDTSPITKSALPAKPNNKTLLLQFLKITLDALKDSLDLCDDFFRLYKCHAYNAMISIVSNSLKDDNFYTKLFIRQENNVDILWKGLVDTNKSYVFQTDFETIPKRRKVLINIRDEIRAQRKAQNSHLQSIKYIESMRVFNSSLSEDLTKFDFTNNIVRTQGEDEDADKPEVQSEIELDCTDINTHECMANVCGLIEHMVRTNVTELPSEDDEDYELPPWVNGIRSLLLNPETHVNVKIFWVKVIDNTMHIFKHFAKWFLEPLLQFLVDKCAGNSINYFVTDVVSILSTWSTEVCPTTEKDIQLSSDLIIFLINNLNNDRQDMFKYQLEMIRLLVEVWKSSVTVPYDLIFSKLNVDPTSRKVEIGIHLSSIFLANKIFPWKDNSTEFCKILFSIVLKSKHKSTYKPCAETIGLLVKGLRNDPTFSKIFNNVHVLLKKIADPEKYANILEAIVLHYPEVADEFHLNLLLSRIHGIPKPLKIIYLKIILSRSNELNELNNFKTERWDSYIANDDLEVQLLSLELVHKCLNILIDSPFFTFIVESVCKHVSNQNVLCRTRMFDILTTLSQTENASTEIIELCKTILIQGLTDSDLEIREKVYNFWKNNHNLSTQISARFAYIMTNLYETTTENDFLGYSSFLLLDTIKSAEEYENTIFEHPLEDCDFENYQLETNWRVRHLSMVPLFVETVRSASGESGSFDTDFDKVRQTQTSLEFAPTQNVRMKQFTQYTMSETSLFVKPDEDKTFVNPNLVHISTKYRVPRRRFLRDKSKILSYFAQQEVKKSVQKVEQRKDAFKERENKVTIYRSYRKGDLPDIQITLQAILEPLQALTLHDGEIAKILFSEIFQGTLHKMRNDQDYLNQIVTGVKTMFNNSTQFNRNLFRTLFDALLHCKSSVVFPPDLIVSVSQSSGLRALGVLLLEEYLISHDESATDSKKIRGFESNSEVNLWIKLAELYKEMDEWDVVKSIFLQKIECPESVKDAIVAESHKQWKDAQDLYGMLIHSEDSLERKDFYYESYFRCFAHLGEWTNLVESINTIVSDSGDCWNELWDNDFNQKRLMPWYISGQLKNSLFTEKSSNQFFTNLNQSLNSEHLEYLEKNFSEEIAMLWIFKGETDEAEKYLKMYMNNFLNYWQQLDPLYSSIRYNNLLKLRNIVDINTFLKVHNNLNIESIAKIEELISYWNSTIVENLPSILYSEERVLYRHQFIHLLENKIKSFHDEDFEELLTELKQVKFKLNESLMDIAIEENNFYMTKKYLSNYNKQNILKLKLVLSKLAHIKSTMLNNETDKFEVLLKGCETLGPIFQEPGQSFLKILVSINLFDQLNQITSLCANDNELFENKKSQLSKLTGTAVASPDEIGIHGAKKLKLFLHIYEDELQNEMDTDLPKKNSECVTVANAYVELAHFTRKQGEQYFGEFMLFVLRAMKFNSSEGRQLFPCIIMAKKFSAEDKEQFIKEVENIPVWMFLGWIPQILVNVDTPKISAMSPLLLKIAKTYPQAIMYAYRLSKENYKAESEESKELIEKLDELLLNDNQIDKFLTALSFIGVPAAILLYHIRKMIKFCQTSDLSQVKAIHRNLLSELYNCKPDSRDVTLLQGNMFKKIAKYEKELKNIERFMSKSSGEKEIMKQLKKIDSELVGILQDPNENKKNARLLKDYCPWLSNFSAHKINFDLEIPGQYDGKRMPLIQHHVKISAFCPNVSIMSSLRKPIKVTILGNDTQEYPFLVKFGEDVRQDQRIEQLFSLMNNIFDNDKNLNGRKYHVLTYEVIPLTTNLGIIQWIDNTNSLLEFVKKSIKDAKSLKTFDQVFETYHKWVFKSANQSNVDAYGRAAMNYSRDKTIPKFRSLASSLEWNILRNEFVKLSSNVESFFALRTNFIISYAVMCTSHWLLGVGDRHLSNSLICLRNGKVLGIDFGHAFGTATQILPVPELIPFRLTPHLVNLMEPLSEKGLFRETMIHCLRSLRKNSGSLLSTMNVFIEEPSLDWLEHASRVSGSTDAENCMWYPEEKIEQARRKLLGANSKSIMIEDLRIGQRKNENYMKAYIKLVDGTPEFDVRARKEGDNLSVEDQADCLIDHATDYNLLGRMFEGWAAWV